MGRCPPCGYQTAARRSRDRGASQTPQVDAGVPQAARCQGKKAADSLFAAEKSALARRQQVVAGPGDLAEGAQLDGKEETLQGTRQPSPVESPGIPLLFLQVDVQVTNDAVKRDRIFQRVQIGDSVLFWDDGFDLGEDAKKGAGQRQERVVLLGTEVVGIVGEPVDHHYAPRPRAVLCGQPAHLARVVSPPVADLDPHRARVRLLRVKGALDKVEGLIDGAVGVDHEVRRQPAAPAGTHAVVH